MRYLILALLLPISAYAQAPQISPEDEALRTRVIQLTGESLDWQAKAIGLQRQVDVLQKELDGQKAKAAEPNPK